MEEIAIGKVAGYFGRIGVAAINITDGELRIGDRIKIKGHVTDFEQEVESMQSEHENLERAEAGTDIGIKVKEKVREHDTVYVLR
jgi:translation initiation factor IF-2